jgi:hypothetical protein
MKFFSGLLLAGVFQSKTPSYSQGLGSYYADEPVPKRKQVGDSASRQTGKHQCPTEWRKQQTMKEQQQT